MKISTFSAKFAPFAVFLFLILSTLVTWRITLSFAQMESQKIFQQKVDLIQKRIEFRLNSQLLAASGFAGLISGSDYVTRAEWSTAVEVIGLKSKYPGFSSMNYVERVTHSEKEAFIEQLRNDSDLPPDVRNKATIFPDNEKDEYFVIKYVEPLQGRESAIGFDIGSHPKRLAAIEQAMTSGIPSNTGKIELVTTKRDGFGFLTPVYSQLLSKEDNEDSRRASLEGFVYLVFRDTDIFLEILESDNLLSDLDIEIYANSIADKNYLLYDSWKEESILDQWDPASKMQTSRKIRVNGSPLVMLVSTQPTYNLLPSQKMLPWVVLGAGTIISLVYITLYVYFSNSISSSSLLKRRV